MDEPTRHIAPNDSRTSEGVRNALPSSGRGALGRAAESRHEDVLAAVLEAVDCGILLFGTKGELWAVNDRFSAILGIEPERLREWSNLEQFVEKLAPQFAHADSVAARWRQRFRAGDVSRDELELIKPEKKILERYARPVLDHYKQPLGWLEIYRDITGQRQLQSRLFHSERLAALGQMVSGVAHELNNALTSIFGYAQLMERRSTGFEWQAATRHILAEAERTKRIARNLLLFGRGSKSERAPVDLNEIVERTVEMRAYEQRLENIRVELDLSERLPQARADASQIQQALLNLVVNAEQAIRQTKESGHIWIRTKPIPENRIAVEVADDGPGVPPEVILRIFDPFFTTKPAGVGTGLGLSILYGIIHQHGGEVSVENRPGGGALFTVELPSATMPSAADDQPFLDTSTTMERRVGPDKAVGSRILVVEDEPTVARLIADVLGEDGHVVDTTLDSREALELAQAGRYDLVICDLRMPHLDGRAFYRQLVRGGNPLQHRLVFVTGDTLAPRTVDFLQRSGLPYLAKPFLVEELKEAVSRTLERTNGPVTSAGDTQHKTQGGYQQANERHWNEHEI